MNIGMRLGDFVGQTLEDPVFRRMLRYQPAEALRMHGLSSALAPKSLPVKHYEVRLDLSPDLLFGVPGPVAPVPPGFDVRWVQFGVRPMALVHGPEDELVGLARWAEQHHLHALLSPSQFGFQADAGKADYANHTVPEPAVPGSGAWRGLLVSADLHHVMLGWLSLLFRWDDFLGRLLGYPECCVEAFVQRWPQAQSEHQGDLAPLLLTEVGPHDARLNPLTRYFGAELLAHFPCSLACEASRGLAARQLAALSWFDPDKVAGLEAALAAPYVYTETQGVFGFPGGAVDGGVLTYDAQRVVGTVADGPVAAALAGQAEVRMSEEGLRIGDKAFAGQLVEFTGGA